MSETTDWPLILARVIGTVLWPPALLVYLGTPLVAPVWATFALWLAAVGWLAAAATWWRRRLIRVAVAPLGALIMWWLVVSAGDIFLGWTA